MLQATTRYHRKAAGSHRIGNSSDSFGTLFGLRGGFSGRDTLSDSFRTLLGFRAQRDRRPLCLAGGFPTIETTKKRLFSVGHTFGSAGCTSSARFSLFFFLSFSLSLSLSLSIYLVVSLFWQRNSQVTRWAGLGTICLSYLWSFFFGLLNTLARQNDFKSSCVP